MARRDTACRLPLSAPEALAVAEAALEGLGWEVERTGSALSAAEDFSRLCCQDSPVSVTITADGGGDDTAVLRIEASVAGFGPLASRSLRTRLAAVEHRIREPGTAARLPREPAQGVRSKTL